MTQENNNIPTFIVGQDNEHPKANPKNTTNVINNSRRRLVIATRVTGETNKVTPFPMDFLSDEK